MDYATPAKPRSPLIPLALILGLTSGPLGIGSAVLFALVSTDHEAGPILAGFAVPFVLTLLIGLITLATSAAEPDQFRKVIWGLIAAAGWLVTIVGYVAWALHDNPM